MSQPEKSAQGGQDKKSASRAEQEIFSCPKCGAPVTAEEERCMGCGIVFADKRGEFACPECGAIVGHEETACQSCGTSFDRSGMLAAAQRKLELAAREKEMDPRGTDIEGRGIPEEDGC